MTEASGPVLRKLSWYSICCFNHLRRGAAVPEFTYIARTISGQDVKGLISADSRGDVMAHADSAVAVSDDGHSGKDSRCSN